MEVVETKRIITNNRVAKTNKKTPPSRDVGLEGGRNHVLVFGFCVKPLDVSHHLIGVVKSDMFVVCGFFIFCGCEMTR